MNNDTVYRKDVEQMLAELGGCDASEEWEKGWDEAIDTALNELRKVKSADRWIPIDNDKPPLGIALMVTVKNHLDGGKRELRYPVTYMERYYEPGYSFYMNGTEILLPDYSEVIAWKPLPEPWEREE